MSELTARLTAVKAFLAEYPAVFVFGSLLIAYIVVKLRAEINKSKRSVQQSQSGRPIGRATLGSNTDANRGAQVGEDCGLQNVARVSMEALDLCASCFSHLLFLGIMDIKPVAHGISYSGRSSSCSRITQPISCTVCA